VEVRVQSGRKKHRGSQLEGLLVDSLPVFAGVAGPKYHKRAKVQPDPHNYLHILRSADGVQPVLVLQVQQGAKRKHTETDELVRGTGSC